MTEVIGIVGSSAAGKSSLANGLKQHVEYDLYIIECDQFYKPAEKCPTFNIEDIPWPNGTPQAFKYRGNANLNDPDAVSWMGVLAAVHKFQLEIEEKLANTTPKTAPTKSVIIVEGLLLLADHEGSEIVRTEIDKYVILDPLIMNEGSRDELCRRKYTRAHLNKPSYQDQGVGMDDYRQYWESHVEHAWITHGRNRIEEVCPDALRLNCCAPYEENVTKLLNTGWFHSRKKQFNSQDVKKKVDRTHISKKNTKFNLKNSSLQASKFEEKKEISLDQEDDIFGRNYEDNTDNGIDELATSIASSGPSWRAYLIASVAAAVASALNPTVRAGLFVCAVAAYYLWRGRSKSTHNRTNRNSPGP